MLIVISGGPGSGKSTLLDALAARGERCYPEVSRALIREQRARGGALLPWMDLRGFAAECARRMRADLADGARFERAFFDRGLPDVMGYARHGGLTEFDRLAEASAAYTPLVFFAPPWPEIYVNDPDRPQSRADAEALSASIRRAYLDCGFEVVDLIKESVEVRVDQVLARLEPEVVRFAAKA